MKTHQTSQRKGVTLIELSLVIGIILILVSISSIGISSYRNWEKGLAAGEDLKAVYQAQKLFLADNPTSAVADITQTDIIAYLPNGLLEIPQVKGLDGSPRDIIYTVSPPIIDGNYDPSPPGDNSLWDAGQ